MRKDKETAIFELMHELAELDESQYDAKGMHIDWDRRRLILDRMSKIEETIEFVKKGGHLISEPHTVCGMTYVQACTNAKRSAARIVLTADSFEGCVVVKLHSECGKLVPVGFKFWRTLVDLKDPIYNYSTTRDFEVEDLTILKESTAFVYSSIAQLWNFLNCAVIKHHCRTDEDN